MGTIGRFILAFVIAVAAGAAAAQQEASPYSLGLSVGHAPFSSVCPATTLYCSSPQGSNLSLVGRAQLSSLAVFGKVGATSYARSDTSVMGMAAAPLLETGGGLSWGGGVSYDFTPRLSATFEWISYELRMPVGPVRTTSLGLRYRY